MFKLKKWASIRIDLCSTYKIIYREINNSNSFKILKNRFKKMKKSSLKATLILSFFENIATAKNYGNKCRNN